MGSHNRLRKQRSNSPAGNACTARAPNHLADSPERLPGPGHSKHHAPKDRSVTNPATAIPPKRPIHTAHLGRACDAPPGTYGTLPTPAQKAAGDALAATLQASAARTGVHYLIWYGRIWNTERAHEGWRPYQGPGVYNTIPTTPDGITGGHYDHVHISVY